MKIVKLIYALLPLGWTFGCAESHPPPAAYYTEPTPAFAPTSTRPDVRVYSPMAPTVSRESYPSTAALPPVGDPDVVLGQSISQLLKGDPYLNGISRNVEAIIKGGVVTLRGSVPTENDRQRIKDQVSRVPGVLRVDDDLGVDLR